ncbi:hypothetical protein EUAN_19880 [Andreesenia angusta]|uniref:Uncharacterized protein n=1 Tax=Andreesenia angusta TaxID=39480 RepID=A0A1S1V553_9FIRM|nr:ATP-binding protein [Andreesenia angusta]OHW61668.1 hypothetical protein EUAN_19880 [Andreesenia angusta]
MAVSILPVDQRVIDIDSRRFASVDKALIELITNCDDSYTRQEGRGRSVSGVINIGYERHRNGAFVSVSDQAEGMDFERLKSILTYGGAFSSLSKGETVGRGYFGRGLKQAIYGLGHGWIESIKDGKLSRVDLYRAETGEYLFDDGDGDRAATEKDYKRLMIPEGGSGTKVGIVVENREVSVSQFQSLKESLAENIYLRDIIFRRDIGIVNLNLPKNLREFEKLEYIEPKSEILLGPNEIGDFKYNERPYTFTLTLKRALDEELETKGDRRTNGLLVLSGAAVLDCQFFKYENQLGTEYLFGTVECDGLSQMLADGMAVISDERDGLNMKDLFVQAFSDSVSEMVSNAVKSEQLRLSHVDRAKTSQKTDSLIESVLQKMNRIAFEELGIRVSNGEDEGSRSPIEFTDSFYYRKVGRKFHISLYVDSSKLRRGDVISFKTDIPKTLGIVPALAEIKVSELTEDGTLVFEGRAEEPVRGSIEATVGSYSANCEIVVREEAPHRLESAIKRKPRPKWDMEESTAVFRGYELRNLGNDMDRAVYSREERTILINTEAPTVRLYVDGQGKFTDGARLLLAELLLDVITDEMAHRYIDRRGHSGREDSYRKAKAEMVRKYGVEIHSTLLGK